MQNITFVFLSSRVNKLQNFESEDIAKEFFYGYQYINSKEPNVDVIEFGGPKQGWMYESFWTKFDKILRKLTKLAFFSAEIMQKNKRTKLLASKEVILVGDRVAISLLFLLIYIKLTRKEIKTSTFVMGLFSNEPNDIIRKFFYSLFIKLLLWAGTNFLFLGQGEFQFALNKYKKFSQKFHFIPFSVDFDFWREHQEYDYALRKKILFVGNDGKRDFEKLINIAKNLPEFEFHFISKRITPNTNIPPNVYLQGGDWASANISDKELKNIYQKCKFTIIPLINSLQPSGQSVALQSISSGTPVLISKTDGFWDHSKFKNNKNIILLEDNSIDSWVSIIKKIYADKDKLQELSQNGKKLIETFYDLRNFYRKMDKVIFLKDPQK